MTFKLVRHVDAAQAGVAFETDTEHVESFALGPIGGAVDGDGRIQSLVFTDIDGQPEPDEAGYGVAVDVAVANVRCPVAIEIRGGAGGLKLARPMSTSAPTNGE